MKARWIKRYQLTAKTKKIQAYLADFFLYLCFFVLHRFVSFVFDKQKFAEGHPMGRFFVVFNSVD